MTPSCRHCSAPLTRTFVDLGAMPLANSYVRPDQDEPEKEYPLHVMVCDKCLLVQLDTTVPPEAIFTNYDYFSSTSPSWVAEAEKKCEHLIEKLTLTRDALIVEVGSNDGYLLRHFVDRGFMVRGIDPARACAMAAAEHGVYTRVDFFGEEIAKDMVETEGKADVVTGTNVFAHCPDINDFVAGLATMVKPDGVVILEFPHLLTLIQGCQFDTIYHEHYFYFSLHAVMRVLRTHGLYVFDVEILPTHGGSLRVFSKKAEGPWFGEAVVYQVLVREREAGLDKPEGYGGFAKKVLDVADGMRDFLAQHFPRKSIAAYGAPAKGSTFLNYCGVKWPMIEFAVDDSPHKQGKLMPGSRVPIVSREHLLEAKPDYVLVLPWNLLEPIRKRNPEVEAWGGRWITAIPEVTIHEPA
jgi:2-polyprenyl-3-methyl-5-hydroxy-6-metoxy-1,4-benzoquinol methylase